MRTGLVLGAGGQDGSYLSELLLSKGYNVYGMVRRSSTNNLQNLSNCIDNPSFRLINGDITDQSSLFRIIEQIQPDEIYNLAAQSHVGISFNEPLHTMNVVGVGVVNLLEVCRQLKYQGKIYNAGSSEQFGNTEFGKIQNEETPFNPRSPYACAKTYAHNMCMLYRNYGLKTYLGILMNHECIKYDYPLFIKDNDYIDILSIEEVAFRYSDFNSKDNKTGNTPTKEIFTWDGNNWSKIKCISWFKNTDKQLHIINARNAVYSISEDHVCLFDGGLEKEAKNILLGDRVKLLPHPSIDSDNNITLEEAEILGMLCGDGSTRKFCNSDADLRDRFTKLWKIVTGKGTKYCPSISGFNGNIVGTLNLKGWSEFSKKFKIYSLSKDIFGHPYKCVPHQILNSNLDIMEAFLIGYNVCDGLKKNSCTYKFKNFTTNSPIFAAGLLYLIGKVTNQPYNITVEESSKYGKRQFYYSMNLLSDNQQPLEKYYIVKALLDQNISQRAIHRKTNISRVFIKKVKGGYKPPLVHRLSLPKDEVKKIIIVDDYRDFFFDIETESGLIQAPLGNGIIHNSPRRSLNFVTRKITSYVGKISFLSNTQNHSQILGGIGKLKLGNIDSCRDWGHSREYVNAMYQILRLKDPTELVISTGRVHSVKDFLDFCFSYSGFHWEEFVEIDQSLMRPNDVTYLHGDSSKAKAMIGWNPKVTMEEIAVEMIENDFKIAATQQSVRNDVVL